jgi:hypothetical protein
MSQVPQLSTIRGHLNIGEVSLTKLRPGRQQVIVSKSCQPTSKKNKARPRVANPQAKKDTKAKPIIAKLKEQTN